VIAALHLMIQGRVQGVGFRYGMCKQATMLGLEGWVRNCGDGSVEAVVVGPAEHVDMLLACAGAARPAHASPSSRDARQA
jgi:acylphosphatase